MAELQSQMTGLEPSQLAEADRVFVSGIKNLDDIIGAVVKAQIRDQQSAREILKSLPRIIREMYHHFQMALMIWEDQHKNVSTNLTELVQKISITNRSLISTTNDIDEVMVKMTSLQDEISSKMQELEVAKRSLSSANDCYEKASENLEKKRRDRAITAGAGVVATAIPVIGWIAGPAMVVASLTVFEDAVKEAKSKRQSASNNVDACQKRIDEKNDEISEFQRQLSNSLDQQSQLQHELGQFEKQKHELLLVQRRCVDISTKLKETCTVMGVIFGRSKVLRMEADFGCPTLENLVAPLKDISRLLLTSEHSTMQVSTFFSKNIDYNKFSKNLAKIRDKDEDGVFGIIDADFY